MDEFIRAELNVELAGCTELRDFLVCRTGPRMAKPAEVCVSDLRP